MNNTLLFAWTVVTGVGVIALASLGYLILVKLGEQLDVSADAANSLRRIAGDLNQARMTDELWSVVDGIASGRRNQQ